MNLCECFLPSFRLSERVIFLDDSAQLRAGKSAECLALRSSQFDVGTLLARHSTITSFSINYPRSAGATRSRSRDVPGRAKGQAQLFVLNEGDEGDRLPCASALLPETKTCEKTACDARHCDGQTVAARVWLHVTRRGRARGMQVQFRCGPLVDELPRFPKPARPPAS